jgi:DNA-binding MarR family transcriptional regulator
VSPQKIYQAWVSIGQTAISLERAFDQRLRPWNVNASQAAALLVLAEHGPQRMSHLARFLLQQTQTTTDLVDRLERRGLVRRTRHDTDRRVVLVELSETGQDSLKEIRDAMWSVAQEAFGDLSEQEINQLTKSMHRVRDVAAAAGGVPADHLSYAADRLNISSFLSGEAEESAAD